MSPRRSNAKCNRSVLSNGAVLVTEQAPQFESLAIGVWVRAGSRDELPKEAGLSHFLEHMVFKGTATRSALEIAQEIDNVGGEFNAFTSREYTCFHILLRSTHLKLGAEILLDVLFNSLFDSREIERERKVILQEVAMVEDNPEEYLHDMFYEQVLGDHPLGRTILGTKKTLHSFDRKTIVDFYAKHYNPRRMVISVAGDVSHRNVERIFNEGLKKASRKTLKTSLKKEYSPKAKFIPGKKILKKNLEQVHFILGYPAYPFNHPNRFAAVLLNVHLGGGMSSVLFQEIREKRGLAYSVYSSISPYSDLGIFSVYIGTSRKDARTCLDITEREVSRLVDNKFNSRTLKMLKENVKGTILLGSDSVENRMMSIAKNEMFFKTEISVKELCGMLDSVTTKQIQEVAEQFFQSNQKALTVLGSGI